MKQYCYQSQKEQGQHIYPRHPNQATFRAEELYSSNHETMARASCTSFYLPITFKAQSLARAFYSNQNINKKRKETCCGEDICSRRECRSPPALALFVHHRRRGSWQVTTMNHKDFFILLL